MKKLLYLSCSINIARNDKSSSSGERRVQQYIDGIQAFFHHFKDRSWDVILLDNTGFIPEKIVSIIPDYVKIICIKQDPMKNIGMGVIAQWAHISSIIAQYDYFVHYEPRQIMKSAHFFDVCDCSRTTAKIVDGYMIWTGLFGTKTDVLLNYINHSIIHITNDSIEADIFKHLVAVDNILDCPNLDLIWHDSYLDRLVDV